MKRRCQRCTSSAAFDGAICPACGFDHVIHVGFTPEELKVERPANGAYRGMPRGSARRLTCADCPAPIPPGKGARMRCDACREKHETSTALERERRKRRENRSLCLRAR